MNSPPRSRWAPKPNISHSSMRAYDQCPRSWALKYARDRLPPDLTSHAVYEARLAPTQTVGGTVVDTVITEGLRLWKEGGERPRDLYPRALDILREILAYSRRWAETVWEGQAPPQGRYQPLEKAFFGEQWDAIEKDRVLATIRTCLANFESCGILDLIDGCSPDTWVLPPTEGCPWFFLDGIPVYSKWDFAIRADDEIIILDWKTGRKNTESVAVQLTLYGLYAMHEWGIRRQDVHVIPVWLATGEFEVRRLSPIVCETVKDMVNQRYRELMERLDAVHKGENALEQFPATADRRVCASCCFHSCPGRNRLDNHLPTLTSRPIPIIVDAA